MFAVSLIFFYVDPACPLVLAVLVCVLAGRYRVKRILFLVNNKMKNLHALANRMSHATAPIIGTPPLISVCVWQRIRLQCPKNLPDPPKKFLRDKLRRRHSSALAPQ